MSGWVNVLFQALGWAAIILAVLAAGWCSVAIAISSRHCTWRKACANGGTKMPESQGRYRRYAAQGCHQPIDWAAIVRDIDEMLEVAGGYTAHDVPVITMLRAARALAREYIPATVKSEAQP